MNNAIKIDNGATIAEAIVLALVFNSVPPTNSFEASAGKHFGKVESWPINNKGQFAIRWGSNTETNYDICDNDDDLGDWLIHQDLNGIEKLLEFAQVYGLSAVSSAKRNDERCTFLIEHRFYDTYTYCEFAKNSECEPMEFDSVDKAQAWIDAIESETYYTLHNETSRPTYKIVAL